MKRLLAAGAPSIYQIQHCFRDMEETGPLHSPEFTMLEWYELGATYIESMDRTEALLEGLSRLQPLERYQGTPIDYSHPFPRLTIAELFLRHSGLDLGALQEPEAMRNASRAVGVQIAPAASWEECFNKVFLSTVEPHIPKDRPVFVTDYPAAIETLAHGSAGKPFAQRWELYLAGVEIANCYSEETDTGIIADIFRRESLRKRTSRTPHPPDTSLTLRNIPPCSGVALGLDRLFMIHEDAPSLERVIFFPASSTISPHEEQ